MNGAAMDFLLPGSGNVLTIFSIGVVIAVFMFTTGKISFKQLAITSLVMIVIALAYIKFTTKEPSVEPPMMNALKSIDAAESAALSREND
jgi:hypothetical protein